jgi:hypothetical protein
MAENIRIVSLLISWLVESEKPAGSTRRKGGNADGNQPLPRPPQPPAPPTLTVLQKNPPNKEHL